MPIRLEPMANRLPVGPGSRGGSWHDPEYRRAYYRAWRAAHPDYRERETRRMREQRAGFTRDPADLESSMPRPLPMPAQLCGCGCACREAVVTVCGFCRDGQHERTG